MKPGVVFCLLSCVPLTAISAEQYFHCEYLDGVSVDWNSGLIKRDDPTIRPYIGQKFVINRQTGEITVSGNATLLFPPYKPEVGVANQGSDNYQLIWPEKFTTGYRRVTFLNIREALGKGPYQFTHSQTTDWLMSGLCHPSFKP